jgi:hypothetical protein
MEVDMLQSKSINRDPRANCDRVTITTNQWLIEHHLPYQLTSAALNRYQPVRLDLSAESAAIQ